MKYSKKNVINGHAPSNISRFVASGLLACSLMGPSVAFSDNLNLSMEKNIPIDHNIVDMEYTPFLSKNRLY